MKSTWCLLLALVLVTSGCRNISTPTTPAVTHTITTTSMDAWHRGVTAYQNGDIATAIQYYTEAIERDQQNFHAYADRGLAYALEGNRPQAKTDLDIAQHIAPNHPAVLYNLAMYHKLDGELDSALDAFNALLKIEPHHAWSLYGVATIYADKGDDKQALLYLQEACRYNDQVRSVAAVQDHFANYHDRADFRAIISPARQ